MSSDKGPPQFVFDMMVAQTARRFLSGTDAAEEVADAMAASFDEIYDTDQLSVDLIKGVERILVFIESVNVDDVDMLLHAFVYYTANYENLRTKRNKAPLFGGLLKGRPRDPLRAVNAAKNFSTYAFGVAQGKAPPLPEDWTHESEEEMEEIMTILFPKPDPNAALLAQLTGGGSPPAS